MNVYEIYTRGKHSKGPWAGPIGQTRASSASAALREFADARDNGRNNLKAKLIYKSSRKNPTKAQKRLNASKRSKQKRMAVALKKYLQQQNPGMKLAGAKVQRLTGGVLKITPIKSIRGRK